MLKSVKLKDISKLISSGITPLRSNELFWKDGIISWLKTEQLGEFEIYETSEKISKQAIDETSIKIFPINTLSIAMYGEGRTRGNVSILKKEMTTNQACCNIVLDSKKADYKYVYYFLKTQYHQLRNLSSGVRKNLNSNDIKEFEIRIPENIKDQERISAILYNIDSKIELNNKINAELEAMAKTTYDYWFVQFDFPNAKGKPYKSSGGKMVWNEELKRELPEGWKILELQEIAKCLMGQSPKGESYNQDGIGIPLLNGPADYENGALKGRTFTTEPTRLCQKDDLVLCIRATIGNLVYSEQEFCLGRGVAAVRPNDKRLSELIYFLLIQEIERFKVQATGSIIVGITKDDLIESKCLMPPDDLINSFHNLIKPQFDKVRINIKENQQLASLRDWLLPMLMNGQVKVGDTENSDSYRKVEEKLSMAAKPDSIYQKSNIIKLPIPETKKSFAKQVLAGKIVSLYRDDKNFTDIKFQKLQYLAEHIANADLDWNYYRKMAGPYDNKFMHTVATKLKTNKWFEDRKQKFKPLAKANDIEKYYQTYFNPAETKLNKLFNLLKNATEAHSEVIATVYAIWNNLIINKEKVTDEKIVKLFFDWSTRKETYTKKQITDTIKWVKDKGFEPTGFGYLIKEVKGKQNMVSEVKGGYRKSKVK